MCQEGELSTAIREPGTLCVPVTGMRGGMRLESFVPVLDLPLVSWILKPEGKKIVLAIFVTMYNN